VLGPYCGLMLAQMGAEVVKVEPPQGDIMRVLTPGKEEGLSSLFLNFNRGKRSVVLDLKQPEGQRAMSRLLASADVFVHNMQPETAADLGLSYDEVCRASPRIVYCAVYGFGQDGPYAGHPAYDDIIQAASGMAGLQGHGKERPQYVTSVVADKVCALNAAYAILAALFQREKTGMGQSVEIPMFETMAAFVLLEQMGGMTFEPPTGPAVYPRTVSPHRRPYRTADGYIGVLPYSNEHWHRFFVAVGRPELRSEERYATPAARTVHVDDLYSFVEHALADRSTSEWLSLFQSLSIPAAPVNSVDDLFRDPHLNTVDFFDIEQDGSGNAVRSIRPTIIFSGSEQHATTPAPRLGEHTESVFADLGLSPDEIARLVAMKGSQTPGASSLSSVPDVTPL